MKTTLVAIAAILFMATSTAYAQTQTALAFAPVISTISVRPDVSNSVSIELWSDNGNRLLVYRGMNLTIVPRGPHFILKVVVDPSATEGNFTAERSLGGGIDQGHLHTLEIAVLANGKGERVQNLSKNLSEVAWRTTDLDATVFITTQSKIQGGHSSLGISGVVGVAKGPMEAKGGSFAPALFVEPASFYLTGKLDIDRDAVWNFQHSARLARVYGYDVQEISTHSDKTSTAIEPSANPEPVKLLGVISRGKKNPEKTVVTFYQNGVHVKVVAADRKQFAKGVTYHGHPTVSNDGFSIECDHDTDSVMTFPAGRQIQVFANGTLIGTYGG